MRPWQSLRRTLPLLVSVVLCLVSAAVTWVSYRQIENVLISASGARLTTVTLRLAGLLEESARRLRGDARQLAADSTLARFLAQPTAATRAAVTHRFERERARATQPVSLALWNRDRQSLLVVGPSMSVPAATIVPSAPGANAIASDSTRRLPGGAWVGSLVRADSGVAFAVVAPVLAGGDTLGFVVAYRRLRAGASAAQIAGLIGSNTTLLIGNAAGGLWSDLSGAVAGPPDRVTAGVPTEYTMADGTRLLGVGAPIRGTPWMVWIQVTHTAAIAAAQPFLFTVLGTGTGFVLLGTIGVWLLIYRMTQPLADVTQAAEDIARGDYTRRVTVTRRDELGRLGASFNSMAAQVDAASRALRTRAGELELANEGLRASEERYRRLVEAAHEGVCTVDANGVVTYANARLAQMLGYDVAALLGRSIFDFMDADAAFDARTGFARRQRGIAETREVPFRRQDGRTVWAMESVSSLFDAEGTFSGSLLMLIDVTDHRAAEERIRSSERHFRALIEHASDMIAVLDRDGIVRYVSPALERYAGKSGPRIVDAPAVARVHPDDVANVQATLADVGAEPARSMHVQFRYRHTDGSWRHFSSVATNLLADPAVEGIVVNSRDVTDQRSLEAQLFQAQKMEAVGQLAGGVAHDFNNMLTVVTSYTGMLLAELPAEDATREDLEEIRRAADRAAALTRQLLAFSRQQVLDPRVLDINAVARDLEKMLGRLLREDVRLETTLAPSLGRVYADAGSIEQVIVNLAVNARDAMPDGGTLTIETADVELDGRHGRLPAEVKPGPYVMLVVRDTGIGMDAMTQARIFEPFFTTKSVGQGTGLGLATVYGIVKQSGGHIRVQSERGIGTTFRIYLPRSTSREATIADTGTEPGVQPGRETILLVEDDAQVRVVAHRILADAGYRVLEASSGAEALRLAGRNDARVDLLLTDMVMPDMNGRELASRFRVMHPEASTAFMSGYTADAALRQSAVEAGSVVILKPFTPQSLTRKLREALDGAVASRAS